MTTRYSAIFATEFFCIFVTFPSVDFRPAMGAEF